MSSRTTKKNQPRKDPVLLRLFRWCFPKVYALSPSLAGNLATKLFFKIFRYPFTTPEKEFLKTAEWKTFPYRKINVTYYHWKNDGKPSLYFVHGWQGRAAQFRVLINALIDDFDVIGIDLPAHGKSEGKRTNIKHSAEFLSNFQKQYGKPHAIICHSFGGLATIFSRNMFELDYNKLVTIGSPVIGQRIYEDFLNAVNAPASLANYINEYIIENFDVDFGKISSADLLNNMEKFPMLAVHDRDDQDAAFAHLEFLRDRVPHVEIMVTTELGHTRILRNAEVISRVKDFLINP